MGNFMMRLASDVIHVDPYPSGNGMDLWMCVSARVSEGKSVLCVCVSLNVRPCVPPAHLELLFLEHVGPGGVEDVISQLGLAVDVDRCGGLTGQEAVVDLSSPLGEL